MAQLPPSKNSEDLVEEQKIQMNKDLEQWIAETQNESDHLRDTEENQKKTQTQKPKGKCTVCGKNKGKFICVKCEKPVCSSCYFNLVGLCKNCIPQELVEKWEEKNPDWEKILGVDWVE